MSTSVGKTATKPIATGRTAELYAWGDGKVLKLFMGWCPPHWAGEEAAVARVVHAAGVPSPAVLDVVEVEDRRGIIYERARGRSMLVELRDRPWRIVRLARMHAELHAGMHSRPAATLPPQRERMEYEIRSAQALPDHTKAAVLELLSGLPGGNTLCHGDFHPGNVLISHRGPVVIDWPNATCGNRLADVARTSVLLRMSYVPPGTPGRPLIIAARNVFHYVYLRRYLQLRPASRRQLEKWRVPVAAARLSEGIREEEAALVEFVERGLHLQSPRA